MAQLNQEFKWGVKRGSFKEAMIKSLRCVGRSISRPSALTNGAITARSGTVFRLAGQKMASPSAAQATDHCFFKATAFILVLVLVFSGMLLAAPRANAAEEQDLLLPTGREDALRGLQASYLSLLATSPADSRISRLAGSDRYQTALEVAVRAYPNGVSTVVVAKGTNYPDALSAAGLAGVLGAPILLVPDNLASVANRAAFNDVKAAIATLKVQNIFVLGSVESAPEPLFDQLAQTVAGQIMRVWGADRFATNIDIYTTGKSQGVGWSNDVAFVTTGHNYADAASVSAVAYKRKVPIILSDGAAGLSSAALEALKDGGFFKVVLLGSTAAVPSVVETQLRDAGITNLERWQGEHRFATSTDIANKAVGSYGFSYSNAIVTNGGNYPDALTVCSLAAALDAPVLLAGKGYAAGTRPAHLPDHHAIVNVIGAQKPDSVTIIGQTDAVSQQSQDFIRQSLLGLSIPSPKYWNDDYIMHATVTASGGSSMYASPGGSIISVVPYGAKVDEVGYGYGSPERETHALFHYQGIEGWIRFDNLQFEGGMAKPVIYLYPTEPTDISVSIEFAEGAFTRTIPEYGQGWRVTAHPDGSLIDTSDGQRYPYLFWEAEAYMTYDCSAGFVVRSADVADFLSEKLRYLGLSERETADFMEYWQPRLKANAYNLVSFQSSTYDESARLHVSPTPDSVLRVFMAYKPLARPIDIPEQQLVPFARSGFTVVEWGGGEIPFAIEER